jgi:hypothetical protein
MSDFGLVHSVKTGVAFKTYFPYQITRTDQTGCTNVAHQKQEEIFFLIFYRFTDFDLVFEI